MIHSVFKVLILVTHKAALFIISLTTLLHFQPLLWRFILLVLSMIMKKKGINKDKDITVLLEVTVTEGYIF